MAGRSRKEVKTYHKYLRSLPSDICKFCDISEDSDQFVSETKSFKIIRNIFPYSYWDLQLVEDHLMVVPKKHTETISDLSSHEAIEYIDLIGSFEHRGYNVYSRAPANGTKSVAHQHTHLIKPQAGGSRRAVIYSAKPYIRITL